MGTISRFRHVVSANVNAMLERAEDPQKMLSALVREMEDALAEARAAAGELLGERKRFERRLSQIQRQQQDWTERAEKAVVRDRDDLARVRANKAPAIRVRNLEPLESERKRHRRLPALLLVDYHLDDGETGIEAVQAIRRRLRKKIPAIIITADYGEAVAA